VHLQNMKWRYIFLIRNIRIRKTELPRRQTEFLPDCLKSNVRNPSFTNCPTTIQKLSGFDIKIHLNLPPFPAIMIKLIKLCDKSYKLFRL